MTELSSPAPTPSRFEAFQGLTLAEVQAQRLKEILDPTHAMLIVVDMQNDFIAPDGKSAGWGHNVGPMQAIVPQIEATVAECRKRNVPVVWTKTYEDIETRGVAEMDRAIFFEETISEQDEKSEVACLKGSLGAELAMTPDPDELIIDKFGSSAFTPEVKAYIKKNNIQTVFLTGVKSQRCIVSSLIEAYNDKELGTHVVVLEDCIASDDVEQHEVTLKEMKKFYPPVLTFQKVKEEWDKSYPLAA